MLVMRGEYCDTGNEGTRPLFSGEPRPAMPGTLYRFVLPLVTGNNGGRSGWGDPLSCRLSAESDWWASDGGVSEPLVGVRPWLWLPSLDESVDCSVRKLARDRRRSSLKLKKEGAMTSSAPAFRDYYH